MIYNKQLIDTRMNNIKKIANIKASYFNINRQYNNNELSKFIELLKKQEKQFLYFIYFLSNIKKEKYHFNFEAFNEIEKQAIIYAFLKLKVIASLIPENIAIPV